MTNTLKLIAAILLAILLLFSGSQLNKYFTPKCPEIKRDTVSIPFDTVSFQKKFRAILQLKPVVKYKDTGSIKWKDNIIFIPYYKPTKSDTIRDYKAYHNTFSKKDTLTNDPNLFYELNYKITQNQLISADGRYFWKQPQTIINNNPIQPLKSQLYVGTSFGANLQDGFIVSGRITLKTKKDALWSVGASYFPMLSKKPMFFIGRDFKIRLKKQP